MCVAPAVHVTQPAHERHRTRDITDREVWPAADCLCPPAMLKDSYDDKAALRLLVRRRHKACNLLD